MVLRRFSAGGEEAVLAKETKVRKMRSVSERVISSTVTLPARGLDPNNKTSMNLMACETGQTQSNISWKKPQKYIGVPQDLQNRTFWTLGPSPSIEMQRELAYRSAVPAQLGIGSNILILFAWFIAWHPLAVQDQ
jgi:hypothetical protein